MSSVTYAVDLAKNVFEIAVSPAPGQVRERHRLTRAKFEQFWTNRTSGRVVMEACASAHHWGRRLQCLGFDVVLLPAHSVRPYVRRNKTDRTDCEALLEAIRCAGLKPVALKSEEQQAIIALHRMRSQWMATRTARINGLRGILSEYGVSRATGASRFVRQFPELIDAHQETLPRGVVALCRTTYEEIRSLEERVLEVERQLAQFAQMEPTLQTLQQIPGIGLLTATAIYASVGDIHAFKSGRHLASWIGLTPKESSGGNRRRLGRISKQGDPYLRMLLVHGARSALLQAQKKRREGQPLGRLERWVLEKADGGHHNRATVALANKMARIVWALWRHERSFDRHFVPAAA